jgi:alkanesulfonate monooxygenase SsuD/methylene tetrahydromethanopterin reductase-like flavin-dependent oxidoreductase (luciferase family)
MHRPHVDPLRALMLCGSIGFLLVGLLGLNLRDSNAELRAVVAETQAQSTALEEQADALERIIVDLRQQAYDTCISRAANITRSNEAARDQIAIEMANPFQLQSPETVQGRIAAWQKWIRDVPTCPPDPSSVG